MSRQTFLQGAFILLIAGLISRMIGFIPRLMLPRIIGTEGIGLYQMAFPLMTFFLTIVRFGLHVSISKIVAEATASNNHHKIRKTLILAGGIVIFSSLLFTPVIIASSFFLAKHFYTDDRVLYPLLAMTPIIPIIALSTIIRGYFQGKQNMLPTAVSSVLETIIRMIAVLILATLLLPYGLGVAAAGVMIGVGLGEMASLLYLFTHFRKARKRLTGKKMTKALSTHIDSFKKIFAEIWNISLPVTASGLIGTVSYTIEPIVVARSLAFAGIGPQMATTLYGELGGLAIFLIAFPTTFTYSLSVSLVPAISEAYAQKNESLIRHRLHQTLRFTIMIGIPFSVIFYLFPRQISDLLFSAPQVGELLQILAPFSIFLYFQSSLAATLQGLDMAKAAFYNSLFGAVVKTGLIFLLGSRPELGIKGVAMAINAGMMLVTLLHYMSVSARMKLRMKWANYARIILSALVMGVIAFLLYTRLEQMLVMPISLLITLLISSFVYLISLVLFQAVTREDFRRLPWIGKRF